MKLLSIISGILLLLSLQACNNSEPLEIQEKPPVSVQITNVELSDQQVTRTFTGSLEGEQHADVYARLSETVEKVHVREGQSVKQGDILISLDKSGPSSMYRTTESVFLNAEKNYKKMEYLYKEGAISESQYDGAKTTYEVAKADYESASKLVRIESPVDGLVTSLGVSVGDYVYGGQKLATIASVSRVRVKLAVNSRDVVHINEGDVVSVSASEVDNHAEGKVISVSRSADPETRAFEVEVLVDNTKSNYRPGMFVRVSTVLDDLKGVVVIPRNAVVKLEGQETVYVINADTAHRRPVTLGAELEGMVIVLDGLKAGDQLVTLGQTYLDEGFKVKITGMEKNGQ